MVYSTHEFIGERGSAVVSLDFFVSPWTAHWTYLFFLLTQVDTCGMWTILLECRFDRPLRCSWNKQVHYRPVDTRERFSTDKLWNSGPQVRCVLTRLKDQVHRSCTCHNTDCWTTWHPSWLLNKLGAKKLLHLFGFQRLRDLMANIFWTTGYVDNRARALRVRTVACIVCNYRRCRRPFNPLLKVGSQTD